MRDLNADIPDRVAADLRRHEAEQDRLYAESLTFDVFDDDLMHDCIGGGRLVKPVQSLLISYEQILFRGEMTDAEKVNFFDSMRGELKDLREAVKEEFKDL